MDEKKKSTNFPKKEGFKKPFQNDKKEGFKKSFGSDKKEGFKKSFGDDKKDGFKKTFGGDKKDGFKKSYGDDKKEGFKKSYGDDKKDGFKKSFGDDKKDGFKKSFGDDKKDGFKKSYGDDKKDGFKKSFGGDKKDGFKKSFGSDKKDGFKKPFNNDRKDGVKKPANSAKNEVYNTALKIKSKDSINELIRANEDDFFVEPVVLKEKAPKEAKKEFKKIPESKMRNDNPKPAAKQQKKAVPHTLDEDAKKNEIKMPDKNQDYIIRIDDLTNEGEGIGKANGFTLFVKGALPGEKIQAKVIKLSKKYGYAKLMEITKASPFRREARCPVAKRCGGCQLQHMTYEGQLAFKEKKVGDAFYRIGGVKDLKIEPIIGGEKEFYYRNKNQYPVGKNPKDGEIAIGFYAARSHDIVDTHSCMIHGKHNDEILERIRELMVDLLVEPYNEETQRGVLRHIVIRHSEATGDIMLIFVLNGKRLNKEAEWITHLTTAFPMIKSIYINENMENTNVIMGKSVRLIFGEEHIIEKIHHLEFKIHPLSFFQVNTKQAEILYDKALEYADLKGDETVWDAYCGAGTISLFLAEKAKHVYGVEIVGDAVISARENAVMNNISNTTFFTGLAEEVIEAQLQKGVSCDVIVVDPPRKGCEESLLATIAKMQPKKVVYVSCDPATCARDCKYLSEHGYKVEKVQPVDLFAQSVHVETVVLLSHKKSQASSPSL